MSFQNSPPKRGPLVPEVFRDHLLQVPLIFQASCLETIRAAILKEGLNDYSVRVLCRCHKVSTINQYQGVWSKFLLYLDSQKVLHHSVKVCHVINFLSYYSENFDLAYKTIAVYENALRLPLLFGLGMNLDCPLVTHYMLVYMLLNYLLLMALCLLGACLIFCFCSLMNSFHSRLVVFLGCRKRP